MHTHTRYTMLLKQISKKISHRLTYTCTARTQNVHIRQNQIQTKDHFW